MSDAAEKLGRIQHRALIAAAAGVVLCLAGLAQGLDSVLHAYVFAFSYWIGVSLGCLGLLMLQYVASGRWGVLLRRIFEAGAMLMPLMLLLFIPIAAAIGRIYPWSHWENSHPRAAYLNPLFFVIRTAGYFAVWIGVAVLLRRGSLQADQGEQSRGGYRSLSGPGLVLLVLTSTFAAIDWTMSLEPDWSSTMYGVSVLVGGALAALALSVLFFGALARSSNMELQPSDFNDFGNLLLVFVMLSAYVNFSQFLIIWSGNLPEEAVWYLRRSRGGWQWVAALLALGQFLIPFLLLLSRRIKNNAASLKPVALLILAAHFLEWYWLVIPAFEERAVPRLADAGAPLALGGLFLAAFVAVIKRAPLLPRVAAEMQLEPPHSKEAA